MGRTAFVIFSLQALVISSNDAFLTSGTCSSTRGRRGNDMITTTRSIADADNYPLTLWRLMDIDEKTRLLKTRQRLPNVMVTFDSGKEQEYYRANKSPVVYTSNYINEVRRNGNDDTTTKPPVMQDSLSMVSQEETETAEEMIYYIRHAQEKDLKDASRILTNAFFRFHWFTTPLEWLKTYFSLQDSFLEIEEITRKKRKNQDGSSSEEGKTTNKRIDYRIMVAACETKNDAVLGICELDGRPRSLSHLKNNSPRPYICNLAVDKKYRQQGIGKAFVRYCENVARDEWMESYLYLKVRVGNEIAMNMYRKLGYSVMEDNKEESSLSWKQSLEQLKGIDAEEQTIVLLRKMLKEP
jgi:Acetyltransferases